jgi:hypothetical protein
MAIQCKTDDSGRCTCLSSRAILRAVAGAFISVFALATAAAGNAPVAVAADAGNRQQQWAFAVHLDGRRIGKHTFTVTTDGAQTRVESVADYEVRALFVSLFRYRHSANEVWQDGCLTSLDARTRINGDAIEVTSARSHAGLEIESNDRRGVRRFETVGCAGTFAYWDRIRLERDTLINSQTGEPAAATVAHVSSETIDVAGVPVEADHYRLHADDQVIDLWYEADSGIWIAMSANVHNGRHLDYRLDSYQVASIGPRVLI